MLAISENLESGQFEQNLSGSIRPLALSGDHLATNLGREVHLEPKSYKNEQKAHLFDVTRLRGKEKPTKPI